MLVKLPNNALQLLTEFTIKDIINLNDIIEIAGFEGSLRFLEGFVLGHNLNVFDIAFSLIQLRKVCIGDTFETVDGVTILIDNILDVLRLHHNIKETHKNYTLDYPSKFSVNQADISSCIYCDSLNNLPASITQQAQQFLKKNNKPITLAKTKSMQQPLEINFFDESIGIFIVNLFRPADNNTLRQMIYYTSRRLQSINLYNDTFRNVVDYIDIDKRGAN